MGCWRRQRRPLVIVERGSVGPYVQAGWVFAAAVDRLTAEIGRQDDPGSRGDPDIDRGAGRAAVVCL